MLSWEQRRLKLPFYQTTSGEVHTWVLPSIFLAHCDCQQQTICDTLRVDCPG